MTHKEALYLLGLLSYSNLPATCVCVFIARRGQCGTHGGLKPALPSPLPVCAPTHISRSAPLTLFIYLFASLPLLGKGPSTPGATVDGVQPSINVPVTLCAAPSGKKKKKKEREEKKKK